MVRIIFGLAKEIIALWEFWGKNPNSREKSRISPEKTRKNHKNHKKPEKSRISTEKPRKNQKKPEKTRIFL